MPNAAVHASSVRDHCRLHDRRSSTNTAPAPATRSSATVPGPISSNSSNAVAAPKYCDTAPMANSASGEIVESFLLMRS